jgi:hypothetical protein
MGKREEPNLAALMGERGCDRGEKPGRRRRKLGEEEKLAEELLQIWRRMLAAAREDRSLSLPIVPCGLVCSSPLSSSSLYSVCPIFLSSRTNFSSRLICTMLCPWHL